MPDLDAYLRMGEAADKWTAARGDVLFPPNGDQTLATFYRDYYAPRRLFEATEGTEKLFECILRRWRLITGDPPLSQITAEVLGKFRDCLLKTRGQKPHLPHSSETVRSNLRMVQSLLDMAGPPDRHNRDGVGLLATVPWVRAPRAQLKIPKTVTQEHLNAVYLAAVCMSVPKIPGIKPAAWWRALIVLAYNTGLRRRALLGMRMDEIDWQGHRLVLPPKRLKSRRPQIVHLTDTALEHLRAIRTDRELVLPWPSNISLFHRRFHRLQREAGIPEKDHFGLHMIRKTVGTLLWENSPQAAQYALGHTSIATTKAHYIDGGGLVARALDGLPQPWQDGLDAAPEPVLTTN